MFMYLIIYKVEILGKSWNGVILFFDVINVVFGGFLCFYNVFD